MNSQKLILAAIWIAACTNVTAQTQDNSNTQPSAIADKVTLLQSARQAGLPSSIEPKGTIHLSIRKLGDARVSTQQVANELIEWLFVREERLYSTEKFSLIDIHPAAQSLIAIGTDAIAPLKNKLATTASNDDAVLILRCLQHRLYWG